MTISSSKAVSCGFAHFAKFESINLNLGRWTWQSAKHQKMPKVTAYEMNCFTTIKDKNLLLRQLCGPGESLWALVMNYVYYECNLQWLTSVGWKNLMHLEVVSLWIDAYGPPLHADTAAHNWMKAAAFGNAFAKFECGRSFTYARDAIFKERVHGLLQRCLL